ncbi:MAG: TIGR00266 family protein [Candidatus Marsarchaeota archaeon]|nr:TIGR00266 family protein [Candidatus Marsarchaeota archaeon]
MVKYEIIGGSMQLLKFTLDAGDKVYADSGKMISKSSNVKMLPKLAGGIISAIERKVTGASALLTEFESQGSEGHVSVAGIIPGKITVVELKSGEEFIGEHYAFIAAEESVKFSMQPVGIGSAFFGGAGLILQKFIGPGNVFLHVAGDLIEYTVTPDNPLEIDPGHIAGFTSGLKYKITFVDNIRSMMFGGVGLFLAKFEGNGRVIAHSVSRFKLSTEIYLEGQQNTKSNK